MAGSSSSWFRAQRLGRYEIRGELGQGAFGSVFHAFDPQLNREVAIKILVREDARSTARFAREVQAAAKLRHPNIVSVHESGEYQGRPYLVMEYVDGDDLEALATAERRLSVGRAVEIVRDAARAIDHAHEHKVLHRDIKPQNILVDRSGQAQVVDFGLAALRDAVGERLTHTGLPLGTPAFMAPEQMRGETVDEQADVFGLGATLYFALCGRPPRGEGVSPFASAAGARIDPPSSVDPRVPKALDRICLEALHDEPYERHDGAGELADALDRFLAGEAPSGPRRGRAGSAALPLLVLAIAVLGGLLALLVARRSTPADPTADDPTPVAAGGAAGGADAAPGGAARAEALLEEALALARRLGPAEGVTKLLGRAEAAAAGDPQRERIRLALVRHHYHRSHHAELLAASGELSTRPGPVGLETRLMRAITLFRMRRRAEGEALAKQLASEDAAGTFGLTARGYLAAMLHSDHEAALKNSREALDLDPDNHHAHLHQALALTNLGQHDAAIALYRAAARSRRPDDVHARLGMAIALLNKRRKPNEPTDELDQAIRTAFALMAPKVTGVALRTRGHARLFTGRVAESVPDLERAQRRLPDDSTVLVLLGMAHDRLEAHDAAREAFRKAYATEAEASLELLKTIQPLSLRHRIALDMRRPARTPPEVTPFMKAWVASRLQRVSPAARPAVGRAYELMQAGHPWSAIEPQFRAAQEAAPDDAELARLDAEAALGRGHDRRALTRLRQARRLGLRDLALDFLEGETYLRAASRKRGLELMTRVAQADPKGVLGRSAQAFLDWQSDRLDVALRALKGLTQGDDPHLPSLVLLGVIERQRERYDSARAVSTQAATRIGFLDPWAITQAALSTLAAAVRGEDRGELGRAFQFVANTMLATDEATLKLVAASYACDVAQRTPNYGWVLAADRWLHDLRKARRGSPEPYLMSGWLDLLRQKPAHEVLAHWAEARRLGGGDLPPALTKAYQRRFGRAPF